MNPEPHENIERAALERIIDELNEGCADAFESVYDRMLQDVNMLQDTGNTRVTIDVHYESAGNNLVIFRNLIYRMAEEIQKLRSLDAADKALGDLLAETEKENREKLERINQARADAEKNRSYEANEHLASQACEPETCNKCKAWHSTHVNAKTGNDSYGQCRRKSPIPNANSDAIGDWPYTKSDDWCLEFIDKRTWVSVGKVKSESVEWNCEQYDCVNIGTCGLAGMEMKAVRDYESGRPIYYLYCDSYKGKKNERTQSEA